METTQHPLFKTHVDEYKSDLNSKAGRTRKELEAIIGDKPFFKMSSNENALGPSPKAVAAVKAAADKLHEYGYRTDLAFREKLSKQFDNQYTPDQFFTANSGLEIIDLVARAFLSPGTEAIFSNPTFHVYEIFTEINGADIVNVPLTEGTFELDVDGILNAITDKTRLVFITNPNNPTGTMIPRSKVDSIVYNVPDHVIVVHDEAYLHFNESVEFPNVNIYVNDQRNVIGLHSFSKAYGLAGLRVGYAFTTKRIAQYMQKLKRPFYINTLSMEGALAALDDTEHIEATKKMVREGKEFVYPALDDLGLTYWKSHTNFILFKSPKDTDELIEELLHHGISVRSGANNGAPGHIRVTIGKPDANAAFVKALKEILS